MSEDKRLDLQACAASFWKSLPDATILYCFLPDYESRSPAANPVVFATKIVRCSSAKDRTPEPTALYAPSDGHFTPRWHFFDQWKEAAADEPYKLLERVRALEAAFPFQEETAGTLLLWFSAMREISRLRNLQKIVLFRGNRTTAHNTRAPAAPYLTTVILS